MELARMYRFCKVFGASPAEYEAMSYHDTNWLLAIDDTWNEAVKEAQAAHGVHV